MKDVSNKLNKNVSVISSEVKGILTFLLSISSDMETKNHVKYTLLFIRIDFIRTSKLRLGQNKNKLRTVKFEVKVGLCSVRNKNIYHKSRLESISNFL